MRVSKLGRDGEGSGVNCDLPTAAAESVQWSLIRDLEDFSRYEYCGRGIDCSGEMQESSLGSGCHPGRDNSQSNVSFSPYGSPRSKGDSRSRVTELKLSEPETAMPGLSSLEVHDAGMSVGVGHFPSQMPTVNGEDLMMMPSRGDPKEMLRACARAIEDNNLLRLDLLLSELGPMVSVSCDPFQRLAAYIFEALVARLSYSGSSIYKALRCKEPVSVELLSYMHILYEVCPYFKFGYMSANGAIAEATKTAKKIHIIDFMIAQGTQWITLIQALASRPGGLPAIRITGIDDSTSAYARGGGLEIIGQRLSWLAESCGVPFSFDAARVPAFRVEIGDLDVRPDEAVVVNFPLMLHHIPDESIGPENHRDRLIRLAKSLSPSVVTLVEQELKTNTAPFSLRFVETMNHYEAIFESIDVALPRDHKERINMEKHCLAREIVNVITCEGRERVERHELLGKWRSRFVMAGMSLHPLSAFVNATIEGLLKGYSESYSVEERDGALVLCWRNRDLLLLPLLGGDENRSACFFFLYFDFELSWQFSFLSSLGFLRNGMQVIILFGTRETNGITCLIYLIRYFILYLCI